MKRRTFLQASLASSLLSNPAHAQRFKYGLALLHGKLDQIDGNLLPLSTLAKERGHEVEIPNLPWSRSRYLSANWESALTQTSQAINALRAKGARRIVLVGHGIGTILAMSYFVNTHSNRFGIIHGLVALGPGHAPEDYYSSDPAVRESVERARAMVAADQGMTVARFYDSDDGQPLVASLSAINYLSYLDPKGQAAIGTIAEKVSLPVLWISNGQDNAFPSLKAAKETMQIPSRNVQMFSGTSSRDLPAAAAPAISRWLDGF